MSGIFSAGGMWGTVLLALGGLGVLISLGLGGLSAMGRRVPFTAFAAVPLATIALGAIATWAAAGDAFQYMRAAGATDIHRVALDGVFASMSVDSTSRWAAALALTAAVWGSALGALVATGPDARLTPGAAAGAAVTTLVGTALVGWYAGSHGLGASGTVLSLLFFAGGLGVTAAAVRRAADEHMWRVAAARFGASALYVLAIFHAARATDIGLQGEIFKPDGLVSKAADLPAAVEAWGAIAAPAVSVGMLAFGLSLVIALFGFFSEIGEAAERSTMLDGIVTSIMLLVIGVVRVGELNRINALHAVGISFPAAETYKEMTTDLVPSVLPVGEEAKVVRVADGGYGDVFAFQRDHWVRTFRWDGFTWQKDDTPLESVTDLYKERTVLAAIGKNEDLESLVPLLEKAPEGRALLMFRASEVKSGSFVPAELAPRQVSFLPIEMSTTRDLKVEAYQLAGAFDVYWGPTTWYGKGDDATDPYAFTRAAVAGTASKGLHVLGTERKIGDLAVSCLRFVTDLTPENALVPAADRTCRLLMEDVDVLRAEAEGLWELPTAANVSMKVTYSGPITDTAKVDAQLGRELGAVGWCAERMRLPPEVTDPAAPPMPAPEPIVGVMTVQLAISRNTGEVFDTLLDEKSKFADLDLLRCVSRRYKSILVPLPPPPDPAAPPPAKEPEPPSVKIDLDFHAPEVPA
jgi:hypothetical protein